MWQWHLHFLSLWRFFNRKYTWFTINYRIHIYFIKSLIRKVWTKLELELRFLFIYLLLRRLIHIKKCLLFDLLEKTLRQVRRNFYLIPKINLWLEGHLNLDKSSSWSIFISTTIIIVEIIWKFLIFLFNSFSFFIWLIIYKIVYNHFCV